MVRWGGKSEKATGARKVEGSTLLSTAGELEGGSPRMPDAKQRRLGWSRVVRGGRGRTVEPPMGLKAIGGVVGEQVGARPA